jgi:hypothetical protein
MNNSVKIFEDLELYVNVKIIISSHLDINVPWSSAVKDSRLVMFSA